MTPDRALELAKQIFEAEAECERWQTRVVDLREKFAQALASGERVARDAVVEATASVSRDGSLSQRILQTVDTDRGRSWAAPDLATRLTGDSVQRIRSELSRLAARKKLKQVARGQYRAIEQRNGASRSGGEEISS